ncbi:hypothetical protein EG329_002588, partial [Mollisiaceae sp. DMI_Dod_QoI]
MDPLGAAASLIAIIQLSSNVVNYIIGAAGASKERRRLREEIIACELVLLQLQDQSDDANEERQPRKSMPPAGVNTPLYRLERVLCEIKMKLEPKYRLDKALAALKWPFTAKEVEQLISTIQCEKSLLQLELTNDCRKLLRDLRKSDVSREGRAILDWLSPTNYASRQHHFISQRQEGTGLWLLNSTEFKTWVKANNQTLFCPGIPGAGKTILSSIVVDELCSSFGNDNGVGIAYLYCDFRQKDKQGVEELLASLIRQLSQCQPSLPEGSRTLVHRHKEKQTRPSRDDLLRALEPIAAMYSRVFIIVDAVDELTMGCRVSTQLEIRASEHDVRRYLDAHVSLLPSFVRRNLDLQRELKSSIINAVDGMFLLAQLHLNSLTGKRSVKAVRATLANLATGSDTYDHAYKEAMGRIESQLPDQVELAKQVLTWIICARRPLTTAELQHALAVEVGEPELDPENFPELEDIVSLCAGIITVEDEGGIIRLVHYTAQEYFNRTQTHWFPNAERDITTICLTYLSFGAFNSGVCQSDDEFEERLQEYKFYDYAAKNWGHHAAAAPVEVSQSALDFLQNQAQVSASSQAMMTANNYLDDGYSQDVPKQMTGAHMAACFGLQEVIAALLAKGNEPDVCDTFGRTPLSYAAEKGFPTVVQLLLARGDVNPNLTDSPHQWTPLWYAVAGGHKAIVELLLNNEVVEPDLGGLYGRTPLWCAVERGSAEIATLLLEKGGDPSALNSIPVYYDTPHFVIP